MDFNEMNQQEYNDKLAEVANIAATYAKNRTGFHQLREAFNELCEKSGANKGINLESTIGRRTLLVQSVCIKAIPSLSAFENQMLEKELKAIAEDYLDRHAAMRRGRR